MGILDTIQSLAGQAGDAAHGDQAKVAGGFIQALTQHPTEQLRPTLVPIWQLVLPNA